MFGCTRARAAALALFLSACSPLTVADVTPAQLPAGSGGELSVSGAGFDVQTTFALEGVGVEVTLGPADLASPEAATVQVPAAAPAGRYALRARRGGEEARLEGALTLVAGRARVVFVDVGQGDATLVVAPGGEALLIDGGPRGAADAVRAALEQHALGRLDAVILSHFDADHLAGLVEVLAGGDGAPGTADDLVPAYALGPEDDSGCETDTCERLRRLLAWPFEVARPGSRLPLGEVEVEVVAADGDVGQGRLAGADEPNERSAVVRVSFGGRSLLVTGDLTGGGLGTVDLETPLAERTGPIDVLRASHHGSATSSAVDALTRWQPRAVVLSVGTDNAFCHPAPATLERLAATGARLYATGAGIVADAARCNGVTAAPEGARLGLGDVTLAIDADGTLEVLGEPL